MRSVLPVLLAVPLAMACSSSEVGTTTGGTSDAGSAPMCSITRPTVTRTKLTTDGTLLRDMLGRIVVLRGVNAGGRSKFSPYVPFDYGSGGFQSSLDSYLDRAASWGIDTLRLPFTWAAVEPTQGTDDLAYLMQYDALIDGAWARGMYTVIDFHQDVYAEVFCGDGFPAWTVPSVTTPPHHDCPSWSAEYFSDAGVAAAFDAFWAPGSTVQAAYASLWDRMAARYKDKPGVVGFELFNEPGWGTEDMTTFEATTLTTFFSTMIARLHQDAPDTLVFFDATGPDAGISSTSLDRPVGDGIVFAPHYYQEQTLGGSAGVDDVVKGGLQQWLNRGKAWNVPVFIGELGIDNSAPGTASYMTAHFDALDALGMGGTEWEYSVSAEAWNDEDLGLVAADGTEAPKTAALVRAYPRAVAGDAVAFAFDSTTGGFTLTYTPKPGVTEIAVPARLYPRGYDVAATGACVDTSTPGLLLVEPVGGATMVAVSATAR